MKYDPENDTDDLLDALTCNKCNNPSSWNTVQDGKDENGEDIFKFEKSLLLNKNVIEIDGKFSEDLDLTYTEEEIRSLFCYKTKTYDKICKLIVEITKHYDDEDLTEHNDLMQDLMNMPEFNYLSEENDPRHMLYYVCVLNE